MRCTLAALTLATTFVFAGGGCDRSGASTRPADDALHLPRMGTGEFHAEETTRPVQSRATLPRTSPRTLQDALQKETEVAEHIVELWWASRQIHDEAEDSRVAAAFAELRDVARAMDTPQPYTEALRFTMCSLGDGHLRVVDDPAGTREYFSGLHFDRAGDDIVVSTRSVGGGKGAEPKPQGGDRLIAADETPIGDWLDRVCLVPGSTQQHRHAVALGSLRHQARYLHEQPTPRQLTLQRSSGETYTIEVDWQTMPIEAAGPCVEARFVDKKAKIALLRVRTFWCQDAGGQLSDLAFMDQLRAAHKTLTKAKHVVVDLRGNSGGTEWSAKRVLGMLRGGRSVWTRQRTRHPYQATSVAEDIEHRPAASDPVLTSVGLSVLIDAGCADSCELLVGALQGSEGVTMIGRATAGSVGTTSTFRLPYSGLSIAVPVTEHHLPNTQMPIEGRGVVPDVEVIRARSDIGAGADADLEVALERFRREARQ